MSIKLVDAHIHLSDPEFNEYLPAITQYLNNTEITLLSNSIDLNSSIKTLELSENLQDKVLPFIGIHPCFAEKDLNEFKSFFFKKKDKIRGIGEIGLDKKYALNEQIYLKQIRVFESLLELAEEFKKPISVHSRGFPDRVIETISSFDIKSTMLHWFSGNMQQLSRAVERGYYISIGPTVIYSKKSKLIAENIPKELLLTETDGPVKFSCFSDKPAMPSFIPSVIFSLSYIHKLNFKETSELIKKNTLSYLNIKI